MDETNPYTPPNTPLENLPHRPRDGEFVRGTKKGPALYIVVCALIAGFASPQYLMRYESIGFVFPIIGCIAGALIYRLRSNQWPIDPTAKKRMLKYSIISILLPTAIMFVLTGGGRAQGAGMVAICLFVGISVAVGIILSGTRRHGKCTQTANPKTPDNKTMHAKPDLHA
jgi:hypothetical protein